MISFYGAVHLAPSPLLKEQNGNIGYGKRISKILRFCSIKRIKNTGAGDLYALGGG